MGPALGQGANQAFIEAVALGQAIQNHGISRQALQHYERPRRTKALSVWLDSKAALLLRRTGLFNTIGLLPESLANHIFARSLEP
jgi:2-polyprenyl-6-methoxyphenol hydroxylase-like FAD-dependent oxidoreductase